MKHQMHRHDPGKRGTYVMGQNTRHRSQPLVPHDIAIKHGMMLDYEIGMMRCGCKVYAVKTPGIALPLNTTVVGMHSTIYGCALARSENMLDPEPNYRR